MATFVSRDDDLQTCPYNRAHRFKESRMQIHLAKCRKQHPEAEIDICSIDARHRIPRPEMAYHLLNCPSRGIIDRRLVADPPRHNPPTHPNASFSNNDPELAIRPTESWDDEIEVCRFDFQKKAAIFKDVQEMMPAERREHYKKLHGGADAEVQEEVEVPKEPAPLRQPRSIPNIIQSNSNLTFLGLSRGMIPQPNKRIAANIFPVSNGSPNGTSNERMHSMGRGFGHYFDDL